MLLCAVTLLCAASILLDVFSLAALGGIVLELCAARSKTPARASTTCDTWTAVSVNKLLCRCQSDAVYLYIHADKNIQVLHSLPRIHSSHVVYTPKWKVVHMLPLAAYHIHYLPQHMHTEQVRISAHDKAANAVKDYWHAIMLHLTHGTPALKQGKKCIFPYLRDLPKLSALMSMHETMLPFQGFLQATWGHYGRHICFAKH